MKKVYVIFGLSLLILFTACDKFQFPKPPYPQVQTLSVSAVSESGATLSGKITYKGEDPIVKYGFVWGEFFHSIYGLENTVNITGLQDTGKFNYVINSGMISGHRYIFKAFVTNSQYTVYGDTATFLSKGTNSPVITGFTPDNGTWGDTIKVSGLYFSDQVNLVKLTFQSLNSKIISCADTLITCIVPDNLTGTSALLNITIAGKQSHSSNSFILNEPVIDSFSPSNGTFQDIITITGKNFNTVKEKNIVKFNEFSAVVTEGSRTSLKVLVPSQVKTTINTISVSSNLQTDFASQNFMLNPPEITSLSATEGYINGTIQITGDNFNPLIAGNTVLFETYSGTITSASRTNISVTIPFGVYKNRSFQIVTRVAGQSAVSTQNFTLKNAWLRKNDVPHNANIGRYNSTAFSINGFGYLGLGNDDDQGKFWKYDHVENLWSEIAQFPGGSRTGGAVSFVAGNKAYVGLGANVSKGFWSYDPETNSWSAISDFPYAANRPVCLSLNNKGYVLTRNNSSNFWVYDPLSDLWSQKHDFPITGGYPFYPDAGFVVDNRLFIYAADATTSTNQLWEYDVNTDTWIRRADVTGTIFDQLSTGFSVNGYGYIRGEQTLFRYDPVSDTWSAVSNDKNIPGVRQLSVAFNIGNLIYFGTSYTDYTYSFDFWEFNPDYL